MEKVLETRRTILSTVVDEDLEDLYKLHIDKKAMEYIGGVKSLDYVKRYIKDIKEHQIKYGYSVWSVRRKIDGEYLGYAGLYTYQGNTIDLGFALLSKYWNQGYGSEVAEAVLSWGEEYIKKNKLNKGIEGCARKENLASINVLKKIKMQHIRDVKNELGNLSIFIRF